MRLLSVPFRIKQPDCGISNMPTKSKGIVAKIRNQLGGDSTLDETSTSRLVAAAQHCQEPSVSREIRTDASITSLSPCPLEQHLQQGRKDLNL